MKHAIRPVDAKAAAPAPAQAQPNILARLHDKFGEIGGVIARRNSRRVEQTLMQWYKLDALPRDEAKARERLALIPQLDVLSSQADALNAAIVEKATERESRLIVAAMLDAVPSWRDKSSPAYIDALCYMLAHPDEGNGSAGFSCAVHFLMARRLIQTKTFVPAPAEALEAAWAIRTECRYALSRTYELVDLRGNAEDVISILDGTADLSEPF
jgi:hypothetical protein